MSHRDGGSSKAEGQDKWHQQGAQEQAPVLWGFAGLAEAWVLFEVLWGEGALKFPTGE